MSLDNSPLWRIEIRPNPASPGTLTFAPPGPLTVNAGGAPILVTATVTTFAGNPAPAGTVITLASSDPTVASVPASATVVGSAGQATFSVTPGAGANGSTTITGTAGAAVGTMSAATPIPVGSVTLAPAPAEALSAQLDASGSRVEGVVGGTMPMLLRAWTGAGGTGTEIPLAGQSITFGTGSAGVASLSASGTPSAPNLAFAATDGSTTTVTASVNGVASPAVGVRSCGRVVIEARGYSHLEFGLWTRWRPAMEQILGWIAPGGPAVVVQNFSVGAEALSTMAAAFPGEAREADRVDTLYVRVWKGALNDYALSSDTLAAIFPRVTTHMDQVRNLARTTDGSRRRYAAQVVYHNWPVGLDLHNSDFAVPENANITAAAATRRATVIAWPTGHDWNMSNTGGVRLGGTRPGGSDPGFTKTKTVPAGNTGGPNSYSHVVRDDFTGSHPTSLGTHEMMYRVASALTDRIGLPLRAADEIRLYYVPRNTPRLVSGNPGYVALTENFQWTECPKVSGQYRVPVWRSIPTVVRAVAYAGGVALPGEVGVWRDDAKLAWRNPAVGQSIVGAWYGPDPTYAGSYVIDSRTNVLYPLDVSAPAAVQAQALGLTVSAITALQDVGTDTDAVFDLPAISALYLGWTNGNGEYADADTWPKSNVQFLYSPYMGLASPGNPNGGVDGETATSLTEPRGAAHGVLTAPSGKTGPVISKITNPGGGHPMYPLFCVDRELVPLLTFTDASRQWDSDALYDIGPGHGFTFETILKAVGASTVGTPQYAVALYAGPAGAAAAAGADLTNATTVPNLLAIDVSEADYRIVKRVAGTTTVLATGRARVGTEGTTGIGSRYLASIQNRDANGGAGTNKIFGSVKGTAFDFGNGPAWPTGLYRLRLGGVPGGVEISLPTMHSRSDQPTSTATRAGLYYHPYTT